MIISDFILIHLFILLLMINLSQTLLGIWSLAIYILVIIVAFVLIKLLTNTDNEIINIWQRPCADNLCENWLDEKHFVKSIANDEMKICSECQEQNCNQHDHELFIYEQPWKHLLIDENLNTKLENLFEFLLEKYTSPWLMNISYNPRSILIKFKQLIRLVTAALIIRMKNQINIDEFIMDKLPGHLIQHLEMYIHGKRNARSAHFLEECVLKQYGSLVHPAVMNGENELKYFKSIANIIMHTTLPPKYIQCDISKSFLNEFIACCIINPLVDILSDPDKINIILIYLLDDDRNKFDHHHDIDVNNDIANVCTVNSKIYFLNRFHNDCDYEIQIDNSNDDKEVMLKNRFGVQLKQIFHDEHLLFLFTKFAREENFLNYLQFSMHMDSFLNLIINPELRSDQLKKLHSNLKSIYDLYFIRESRDFIDFDDETIQNGFRTVIEDTYENVDQFRNCKSLYEANEFVNNVLENYAQQFFQTESYLELICGHLNNNNEYKESLGNEKLNVDSIMQPTISIDNNQNIQHHRGNNYEQIDVIDNDDDTASFNEDLTNWRVTIPHISARIDDITNRENYYFEIHVQKLHSPDDVDESCTLMINERQFNEFYTLESKLKEFHGEEIDAISLPSRRTFVRITRQLLETHREKFEKFLQQLLSNASMKRSRLFYNFLNSPNDTFEGNFNITKMIRSNNSTTTTTTSGQQQQQQSPKKQQIKNSNNNSSSNNNQINNKRRKSFIVQWWPEIILTDNDDGNHNQTGNRNQQISFKFLYDYILAILIRFYSLSNRLKYLFILVRPIFRQTLQGFCHYHLRKKLKQTFTTINMMTMIDYLEQSLKHDESDNRNNGQQQQQQQENGKINFPMNMTKNQRSKLVMKLLKNLLPKSLLELFVDYEKHEEIVFILFSSLQYRLLNKQLLYLIIDLLLNELYPKNLLETIEQSSSSSSEQ
ncbi:Sorting nexin-14 [Dermatophagoides farinae]|uniref:Sorting nexin-14 n=1 Tax=Dermatophagoides farinae TaxID=6954 RepID=A0A922I790_DERFA|nr:Sorting nexin-14 [Dermatophagoides farinae]